MSCRLLRARVVSICAIATIGSAARPQDSSPTLSGGARAILLVTQGTRTPQRRTLTEGYLTQPILSGDVRARWFHATGMLNLEGLTLRRGELDLGAWGEGYVDRRHPHAYVHELMTGIESRGGAIAASLYGGRGFVPFGSDDPMSRPFLSYPVDHHLAQILERLEVVGALRGGPMLIEAASFNGDEPLDPSAAPLFRRFGDSWAVRGTVLGERLSPAVSEMELAVSYANVKSPEFREGRGLDQRKSHISVRIEGESGSLTRYALLEAARTIDVDRGQDLYAFDALLGEAALCRGDVGVAARWERSDRPEEERLLDLFRSPRPATDVSILGVTQWTTLSAAVSLPTLAAGGARLEPVIEVARIAADRTTAAVFDPARFYGSNRMWRFTAGFRVGAGHDHGRMGRYGVAFDSKVEAPHQTGHNHIQPQRRCFS